MFTIIFHFLRTLLITLIVDERYMCCSMKIQNNSPHKYIAYSQASYYLSLVRSKIQGTKSGDLSVNFVSVFIFSIIFCYHIKGLLIISNFLKINKAIVSNWYQNLDDKLIREVLHSRLTYHRS